LYKEKARGIYVDILMGGEGKEKETSSINPEEADSETIEGVRKVVA